MNVNTILSKIRNIILLTVISTAVAQCATIHLTTTVEAEFRQADETFMQAGATHNQAEETFMQAEETFIKYILNDITNQAAQEKYGKPNSQEQQNYDIPEITNIIKTYLYPPTPQPTT